MQGETNAAALRIEFDPGWDGMAKTVTFWNAKGENEVKRILTADLLEDITESGRIYLAPIPGEAMTAAGKCRFAIDGYISGKRMRSVYSELVVRPAGGKEPAVEEPTPTQAEQLQSQMDTLLEDLQAQAVRAEEAAAAAEQEAQASAAEAQTAAAEAQTAAAKASAAEASRKAAAASQTAAAASAADAKRSADQCAAATPGVASFNGRGGHVMPQSGDYTAAQVGAVALDGSSAMASHLIIERPSDARVRFHDTDNDTEVGVGGGDGTASIYTRDVWDSLRWQRVLRLKGYKNANSIANALTLCDKNIPNGIDTEYTLLHTGNKPSGSYTGNGDSATRSFNTGGVGNICVVWGGSSVAVVTPVGAVIKTSSEAASGLMSGRIKFINGYLEVATADANVNTSGTTYYYQVL